MILKKNFTITIILIFSTFVIKNILLTDITSIEIIDILEVIYDRFIIDGDDFLEYKEKYKEYYTRNKIWLKS